MSKFIKYSILFIFIAFTFTHVDAAERHWVGSLDIVGTHWNQGQNWSTIQGGGGGAGVPADTDDVYIDGGTGVLLINDAAFCKSFIHSSAFITTTFAAGQSLVIATGGMTLSGGTFDATNASTISNKGDWTIFGGTFIPGSEPVIFDGTTNQTLIGETRFNKLTVNNAAGITITANIRIDFTLTFIAGTITT